MGFFDRAKASASRTWDVVRDKAGDAVEAVSDATEDTMKSLAKHGKFSKDDFCKAFVAAGVLMAVADNQLDQSELDKVAARMNLHPILETIRESKRNEYLEKAVQMAENGMLYELSLDVIRMLDVLYDESGSLKFDQDAPECAEIEQKARSIYKMVIAVKDDDAEVQDSEVEMLEAIVFWMERNPENYGLREDLTSNPPAIVNTIANG